MDPDAAFAWTCVFIGCAAWLAFLLAISPDEPKKRKPPWG
jgi:hypothetical protein